MGSNSNKLEICVCNESLVDTKKNSALRITVPGMRLIPLLVVIPDSGCMLEPLGGL